MDSMIKEINDNLKAILDTMKDNIDNSINTLENIQIQMDKKVEEAKKYKIQVDSAKDKIKFLEDENRSLEVSLSELSDKYSKLNLVSLVEAGNREIKSKINDNIKEINKEKEHIAELTNRARTIKDLLINLKKDKTVKEDKLERSKLVFDYYNERLNEIMDYAFDHSENLSDYKNNVSYINYDVEEDEEVNSVELENTMVFDEIANIDENKNFVDEMSFISEQISNDLNDNSDSEDELSKIDSLVNQKLNSFEINDNEELEHERDVETIEEDIDSTQVFDSIINDEFKLEEENDEEDSSNLITYEENVDVQEDIVPSIEEKESDVVEIDEEKSLNEEIFNKLNIDDEEDVQEHDEDKALDEENELRINKINDLFANFENNTVALEKVDVGQANSVDDKIDEAYMDIFGKPLEEDDLNKKTPTLTDIFGNPVGSDELSVDSKLGKKLEELFVENGIDFNKFREDEKNYLKQIYDEDKFTNVIDVLKNNNINLDNIYNAFNIFGEISAEELSELINKLLNIGQSVEAIGLVLEKLPKVKKYKLDEAIMSYGEYVNNVDITEIIMKAKELYKNGGNN